MQEKAAKDLSAENQKLRVRLEELQETLDAIRRGEVDGLVVSTPKGERVYTLSGAETPYRLLIEEMKEGALMLSDDNAILYANKGFANIVKHPLVELVGKNLESIIAPAHLSTFKEILNLSRARKDVVENEIALKAKDNSLVPVHVSVALLTKSDPKTTLLIATDLTQHMGEQLKKYTINLEQEISQRKKAEEEIASLAKFPLENPAAVIRVDKEGILLFANPAAFENLKDWQIKVGQEAPEPIRRTVVEALASGNKIEFEEKIGEEIFSFVVAPIVTEGYANLYGRKITKRKKAEEKLRESKIWEATSFYTRNLIEASLDPLVTISAEGKITDVNKATENVTGCSREELIGSDFSNYFTEPEKAATGYKHAFTEGIVRDYPIAIRHKSGKVTEVLYNASLYRNADGKVEGVFVAARDVTERKKLEKQLKETERLATIGATAGMVGHDIRNPLQAMTSDVYLVKTELASTPESEEKKNSLECLTEIERNIDYINKIVQDLQDYARPLSPKADETDLKLIIAALLAKLRMPDNIELSVKIESKAEKISADSYYITRVMTNLVNNSVQAMPNGGTLTIHVFRDPKDLFMIVKDTGVGIPEDIQAKMFTPMFTTKAKGQGFGLPVVKRMTESLGGTVTFESQEGKGTTFTIRLPLIK